MAEIIPRRMTARIEGDFVVFLIGARINKPWKLHKWLPLLSQMPRMVKELEAHPESGFLGSIQGLTFMVQYWRSFEHLEAYARDANQRHWPVWVEFNKRAKNGGTSGSGTRRTRSGRASTSASTAGCLAWASRRRPPRPKPSARSSRRAAGSRQRGRRGVSGPGSPEALP